MAFIKKKTRKRLSKQIRKLVNKYGQEVVTGIVTSALAAATAKFASDSDDHPKKHTDRKKSKSLGTGRVAA